ncbi:Uncharacterised protein [uncultured archaeon]|nr:Uncharacterised protein [uncultured archaeon]
MADTDTSQKKDSEGFFSWSKGDKEQAIQAFAQALGNMAKPVPITTADARPNFSSDERLKNILGENAPVDSFARIQSYIYKYKPEAQQLLAGQEHVDNQKHYGVMAQDLLKNELTKSTVKQDEKGFLTIDTAKLTTVNTAMIADIAREIVKIEQALGM